MMAQGGSGALRPCTTPKCPTLTRGGPCEVHARERQKWVDETRGTSTERGYGSGWRRTRGVILAKRPHAYVDDHGIVRGHGPLCVMCTMERRVTAATDVDHIDGNPRNNTFVNLRPLCHSHHSSRTATDQGFGRRSA